MKAYISKRDLHFAFTARTSKLSMTVKPSWYVRVIQDDGREGVGECGFFPGLSPEDDGTDFEARLIKAVKRLLVGEWESNPVDEPSIAMGIESALKAFVGPWDGDVKINGLVWIDTPEAMERQACAKAGEGFSVIKVKVGSTDFATELQMLRRLRSALGHDITLRLDANGSFGNRDTAMRRLEALAPLNIHSLEQPLPRGMWDDTALVINESPIDIALDEELIACSDPDTMLDATRPRYIVIKPTLHGGLAEATRWTERAAARGIGWWATSALESNIGLDAIARWTLAHDRDRQRVHGLGTGQIYTNNIPSPIRRCGEHLSCDSSPLTLNPSTFNPWKEIRL